MSDPNPAITHLSLERVNQLAQIAQIELSDAEATALVDDLNSLLADFAPLIAVSELDVAPTARPSKATNVTRADVAANVLTEAEALQNAPETEAQMFKVVAILGGEH